MVKEIICTICPLGCRMIVEGQGDNIDLVRDYGCKRGLEYGKTEFSHPMRILTSTVKTSSSRHPLIPVRSKSPIPKEKILDCMKVLRKVQIDRKVNYYDVIISNICNTGIDMIATGKFEVTSKS